MRVVEQDHIELFCLAANKLPRYERRLFMAEVTIRLCQGYARWAEEQFGWGRETVQKGLRVLEQDIVILGRKVKPLGPTRREDRNPQLTKDSRHCGTDNTDQSRTEIDSPLYQFLGV